MIISVDKENSIPNRYLVTEVLDELKENRPLSDHSVYDLASRIFDLGASTLGLVVISPILLIVALAIKSHDLGPVFYRQERLGWHGEPFSIFKFRTMVVGAENTGSKLRSSKNDPRITPLGRILREYHIDELPQVFNVLLGNMGLVGPRPALMFHRDYYEPWEMPRLAVRPGITGLSQVNGGNAMSWDERIVMDVYFVRHRNVGMSIKILWQTFAQLFVKKGIYGKGGQVKGWTRPVPDWYYDDTMK